jgi:hypothetical protein
MRDIAHARGGECLSSIVGGARSKLDWRCAQRHEWSARADAVKRGSWCPRCAGTLVTLTDLRALASARGGACLAKIYRGADVPHRWSCAAGHEWRATPRHVRYSTWCPTCAGKRPRAHASAVSRDNTS